MSAILYDQNGFRPGRSTITQALALRRILEGVKHYRLPSIMEFIEFSKACNSINHQEMSLILSTYDFPERIIYTIMLKLSNNKEKVVSPDGKYFLESCSLTLWRHIFLSLCSIVLDYAMRQATQGKEDELGNGIVGFQQSVNWPWFCWWHCSSDEIRQARQLLRNVEVECGKVGLSLNAKKTKAVYLNVERKEMETIYGTKIEQAVVAGTREQDFKYLGGCNWLCVLRKET